ncbi:MAG: BON domain-containing protein, partial [Gemmatimonadaceae bacterium]
HARIDASEIEIRVQSGEVTLTGTVTDREQKRMAEDLVEAVSGVKDVQNQIRVNAGQPSWQRGSDSEVGRSVEREGLASRSGAASTASQGSGSPAREQPGAQRPKT